MVLTAPLNLLRLQIAIEMVVLLGAFVVNMIGVSSVGNTVVNGFSKTVFQFSNYGGVKNEHDQHHFCLFVALCRRCSRLAS